MRLELMRDPAKEFPAQESPLAVESMTVWHCKYKTLKPIADFKNLKALKIASFPDSSFDDLGKLAKLEWLSVQHIPKVGVLDGLARLKNLRYLQLQTLPSWDASRKRTVVESLEPLSTLSELVHISLIGVVPPNPSLAALEKCSRLKSARFHGYPAEEVERFFTASGARDEQMPEEA
ncbi:MAG: hypothetical protein ABW190_04795 [Rhizobacter sp.]